MIFKDKDKKSKQKTKKKDLINCPKCGHRISKSARTCSDCGHPIGFISWLIESKLLLLITSLVGINGLWFIDVIFPSNKKENKAIEKNISDGNNTKLEAIKQKMIKCNVCNGEGICIYCRGNSTKTRCTKCKNSGRPGYLKCEVCKGTGKVNCKECGGRGFVTDFSGKTKTKKCNKCKGTGKVDCSFCKNGWYPCSHCKDGYIHCIYCNGTNKCYKCKGKGEVPEK